MAKSVKSAYFCALLALFSWGTVYVVGKYVMASVPPFVVTACRYALAVALLGVLLRRKTYTRIARADVPQVMAVAVLGYFLSMNLQFFGTKLTNASVSSLINSMNPVFITLFAVLLLGEKLSRARIASLALSLAGVWLVVGGARGAVRPLGVACALGAMLSWALMSVLMRRLTARYDALYLTRVSLIIGGLLTAPLSVWSYVTAPPIDWSWRLAAGLLFLGFVGTALGNLCWTRALSVLEASTCSLFYPVMPLTSVLGGALFLGEPVSLRLAAGAALIAIGVVVGVRRGQAPPADTAPAPRAAERV